MKRIFKLFIALSVLLISQNTFAQKERMFKNDMFGIKKLNLTDEQKKKFDQIQFTHEEKRIDLRAKLNKNRLEIKKMFNSENFNENDFVNLTQNGEKLRNEQSQLRTQMWLDVYRILDKGQKNEWKAHFAEMPENFRERMNDSKKMHRNFDDERGKNLMPPPPPMDSDNDEPQPEN